MSSLSDQPENTDVISHHTQPVSTREGLLQQNDSVERLNKIHADLRMYAEIFESRLKNLVDEVRVAVRAELESSYYH